MNQLPAKTKEVAEKQEFTREQVKKFIEEPLSMIPEKYRGITFGFWAKWSDILKTQLSLASRLREWIERYDLTPEDIQKVYDKINAPDLAGRFRYSGDLMGSIAYYVAEVISSKKIVQEQEERRKKPDEKSSGPEIREQLKKLSDASHAGDY